MSKVLIVVWMLAAVIALSLFLSTPSPAEECALIYNGTYSGGTCTHPDGTKCVPLPGGYYCEGDKCGYFWDCTEEKEGIKNE